MYSVPKQGIQKVNGSFVFKPGFKLTFLNPSNIECYCERKPKFLMCLKFFFGLFCPVTLSEKAFAREWSKEQ